jgi:hypothetical protein
MTADQPKPALHLLPKPLTAANLAELWRRLTGREPTTEGWERFRRTAERVNAKWRTGGQ